MDGHDELSPAPVSTIAVVEILMPGRSGPLRRTGIVILALQFALLLAGTDFSYAERGSAAEPAPAAEPPATGSVPWPGPVPKEELVPWAEPVPWPGPVPWPEPAPLVVPPTPGYFEALGKTMDVTHASIEGGILKQTIRLDDFFGVIKSENLRQTTYLLRWRNSFRVDKGGDFTFGTTIRASLTLSKISERLRLFISRENEPGLSEPSLPQDPGNPGYDRTTPTTHFTNTELRYELIRKPAVNLFLGAGVRVSIPSEAFVRSRYQYTRKLGNVFLIRIAETVFVKNSDLLGETTELSLEQLIAPKTILRWSSAGTASEEIEGLEWGSELSLSRELSPRSAIALTGGVYGNIKSSALMENYRLLALYRRNFLRSWLFYELEPEVSWPRDIRGNHPATFKFTFRLEIVFQGTSSR